MNNDHTAATSVPGSAMRYVMPSAYFGLGGFAKAVFPRLDALLHNHYGYRPDPFAFAVFDFDGADATFTSNGTTFSVQPYLNALPRRPFLDVARAIRRNEVSANLEHLRSVVRFDYVHPVDGPGMNQMPQNANLAYRLVWASHVVPDLQRKLRQLNPNPRALERLTRERITVSERSVIWVVAGGASTTGPGGLIPLLAEIRRLKPRETNLFAVVFTPGAYHDKSAEHAKRGSAIFRATLEQLIRIHDDGGFSQRYDTNGHSLVLTEEPFDQIFLVDGSLGGGKSELKTEDLAELVARFLFKFAVGPLGERMLGRIADCNPPSGGHTT